MFIDVRKLSGGVPVHIQGYGHTGLGDPGYRHLSQVEFINEFLSPAVREELLAGTTAEAEAAKWVSQTGIEKRLFFSGTVVKLGIMAAQKALAHAGLTADDVDYIVVGTNTGPGYPSLADQIKLGLGVSSHAGASDTNEACSVGGKAIFEGWNYIRSGIAGVVLVVVAEKATLLTPYDNWKGSNLFGDRAFAYVLIPGDDEAFIFWDLQSLPFDGQADLITKTEAGFTQSGTDVHKWAGRAVVASLVDAVEELKIDPARIDHLVPHQPSSKTLLLIEDKIRHGGLRPSMAKHNGWPGFQGKFHNTVSQTGNCSGASAGAIISESIHDGTIEEGDLVLASHFGSGLSIVNYGFWATRP